jgi:hypothetical protein
MAHFASSIAPSTTHRRLVASLQQPIVGDLGRRWREMGEPAHDIGRVPVLPGRPRELPREPALLRDGTIVWPATNSTLIASCASSGLTRWIVEFDRFPHGRQQEVLADRDGNLFLSSGALYRERSSAPVNAPRTSAQSSRSYASAVLKGHGSEHTHWRTGASGNTSSTRCAATSAIRRPQHDGQKPLLLHENATTIA